MPDPAHVTPGVTRTALVVADDSHGLKVDRLSYEAGSHTHWHLHTGEQVLYGERGSGFVQFVDRPRQTLDPGEVVRVHVGLPHWHGAAPDQPLVHLSVTAGGETQWLGDVTRAQYEGRE